MTRAACGKTIRRMPSEKRMPSDCAACLTGVYGSDTGADNFRHVSTFVEREGDDHTGPGGEQVIRVIYYPRRTIVKEQHLNE